MGTHDLRSFLETAQVRLKILVTGATGFLGSNLVAALSAEHELVLLKRRSSNLQRLLGVSQPLTMLNVEDVSLESLFIGAGFDGVIHCATNYGRDENDLHDTIDANLTLPLGLLKGAIGAGVRFFINTDTVLDKRINYYSLSKAHFRDWLIFFAGKILCINMELEHFYGRGDDPSKFISRMVTELACNRPPSIDLTLGEQKRSFIHISDVVRAFSTVITSLGRIPPGFNVFQVGSRDQVSIRQFVTLTSELCGNSTTELRFGALPYRKNEVMEVELDLQPLEHLGWAAHMGLREGLVDSIADAIVEKGNARKV